MVMNKFAEYSKRDPDKPSSEALLHENERNDNAPPSALPPQIAVLICAIPGQVRHLKC